MHVSSNEWVIDQIVPLYTVITGRRWPSHIPEIFEDLPYRPSYIMSASKPRRGQVRRDRSDLFGDPPLLSRAIIKIPTIRSANYSGYEDL